MLSKNLSYRMGDSRLLGCQLGESLRWEIGQSLGHRLEDVHYAVRDSLIEALNEPEEPWPAPE